MTRLKGASVTTYPMLPFCRHHREVSSEPPLCNVSSMVVITWSTQKTMISKSECFSQSYSVTRLIEELKLGRGDAVTQLWSRYFDQLVRLAKQRLGNAESCVSDEEGLAATVFYALCDGAANQRCDRLKNRNDLWMLLVPITSHKAVDQVRRQTAAYRATPTCRILESRDCERCPNLAPFR